MSCLAIKWTIEPKTVSLYSSENTTMNNVDWQRLRKNYFQIVDFLYFIEELEHYNLIKLQTLSFELNDDNESLL